MLKIVLRGQDEANLRPATQHTCFARQLSSGSGGPETVSGSRAIRLKNVCDGYEQPSVCDIKIGRSAVYAWAPDEYKNKKRCAFGWLQAMHASITHLRTYCVLPP